MAVQGEDLPGAGGSGGRSGSGGEAAGGGRGGGAKAGAGSYSLLTRHAARFHVLFMAFDGGLGQHLMLAGLRDLQVRRGGGGGQGGEGDGLLGQKVPQVGQGGGE